MPAAEALLRAGTGLLSLDRVDFGRLACTRDGLEGSRDGREVSFDRRDRGDCGLSRWNRGDCAPRCCCCFFCASSLCCCFSRKVLRGELEEAAAESKNGAGRLVGLAVVGAGRLSAWVSVAAATVLTGEFACGLARFLKS